MSYEIQQNEDQQCEILSALAKIACAGSRSLEASSVSSQQWTTFTCTLCDTTCTSNQDSRSYWNNKGDGEDWKNTIASMLAITKESKFQNSPKARVLLAVAVGRVFNHISDVDYLDLETCELGQWLLGSMSRSLRELKLAAT
jgi:serine/threonine-protein kinase ATR